MQLLQFCTNESVNIQLQGSGEAEQNELYTFHEAVSQLQDAEEQLVECHKKSVEVFYHTTTVVNGPKNLRIAFIPLTTNISIPVQAFTV